MMKRKTSSKKHPFSKRLKKVWKKRKALGEKLKDEDEAQRLEQSSRAQTGEEGLRSLIEESLEKAEAEPENINVLKDLVNYYRKLEEFDDAMIGCQRLVPLMLVKLT